MNEKEQNKMEVSHVTPAELSRQASDVANVCREIVVRTSLSIRGRRYVRVEGWESIATAHGLIPGADAAERVYEGGEHIGYSARGVLRNRNGELVATAVGFVGFDEKDRHGNRTWKDRAEYAGRAMAQTRAISRVCRSVFAHVVVLMDAGLDTCPAEEVPQDGFDDRPPTTGQSQPATVTVDQPPQQRPPQEEDDIPFDDAEGEYSHAGAPKPQQGSDDAPWKSVICPIPPKGMRRDDYLQNPITLGEMAENDNKRFFGFAVNAVPRPYQGKYNSRDAAFYQALNGACRDHNWEIPEGRLEAMREAGWKFHL